MLIEAYLLIEQPRQRLSHWAQVLAPLDSSNAPPLANVGAFYDATADQAILALCYDDLALGAEKLAYVVEVALLAEIGMVQPAELTDADRRRFAKERIGSCTLRVDRQRAVVGALTELVRLVKGGTSGKVAKRGHADDVARPQTLLGTLPLKRPATPPPIPVDANGREIVKSARGTRDDMEKLPRHPRAGTEGVPDKVPAVVDQSLRVSAHVVQRSVVGRGSGSHPSIPDEQPVPLPVLPMSRARTGEDDPDTERTDHAASAKPAPAPPSTIYARYLRSGRWVPIRIGALSLKGAALLTGALPRLNDHVDVALSFGGNRALVRGTVGKVSNREDVRAAGAATFNVAFELDDASRRQLTSLLTAARAANITIKPPPPRAAQRFPVDWPITVATTRGSLRAQVQDISADGLFVRPVAPLVVDTSVSFSVTVDEGGPPIAGRARVIRQITESAARTAGLVAGFGLQVVDMPDADRARWRAFVARVERRADKRILIGAGPARLAELQQALAAAGYAVTGGTDPGALVQLARGEARPVDAAVVDASFLSPAMSGAWLESLFAARDVPCLTLHGDPRTARVAVDKMLAI